MPYTVNLLRALLFTSYMAAIGRQATFYFPYPFMWIFRDFSKFVFEPFCIRVFEGYLYSREPQSRLFIYLELEYLERIMSSYLGRDTPEANVPEDDKDFSVNNEDVSDNIDHLNTSFEAFKKTVSCAAVVAQIKEFEEINKRLDR